MTTMWSAQQLLQQVGREGGEDGEQGREGGRGGGKRSRQVREWPAGTDATACLRQ